MNVLHELLERRPWLLADGATGTNFFAAGLGPGDAPELWNLDHPGRVQDLHRRFVESGSDVLLTNSFGGTACRLKLHNAESRVFEINRAAAALAREVADAAERGVLVAGSVGPTGEILEPIGALSYADAVTAFKEQARGLKAGGVDLLWLETLSSLEELQAAAEASRLVGLDFVCTLSFDTNGNTMMGVTPQSLAITCAEMDPAPLAFGTNCGVGASEVVATVLAMRKVLENRPAILVAKANCGVPEYEDGQIVYKGGPELMARYACMARDVGARVIGGCCGTTPGHVAAMKEALETTAPDAPPSLERIVEELGGISDGARRGCAGDVPPRRTRRAGRRHRGAGAA